MNTPALHIARIEAELADRCVELAESRKRVRELEAECRRLKVTIPQLLTPPEDQI